MCGDVFFSQCFFFGTATNKIANKMRKKKKFILHRAILCNDAVHAALVCTRVHVLTVRRHTATIQDMLELGRHQTSTSEQTTTTITTTTTTTTVGVRLSCFFLLDVHMHIRVCVCVGGEWTYWIPYVFAHFRACRLGLSRYV